MQKPPQPLRLVSVLDGLQGLRLDQENNLVLHRDPRNQNRNTSHFSLNGLIDSRGGEKSGGRFAIVADPQQVPSLASGFRQDDVWFHHDGNGDLSLGKAMLIAPSGSLVPAGIQVKFYDDEKPHSLEQAISRHLLEQGVEPRTFGSWGWADADGPEQTGAWLCEITQALYGEKGKLVQLAPYSTSFDDAVDKAVHACEGAIELAREARQVFTSTGAEVPATDLVQLRLQRAGDAIRLFEKFVAPEVRETASHYLASLKQKLVQIARENTSIKEMYELLDTGHARGVAMSHSAMPAADPAGAKDAETAKAPSWQVQPISVSQPSVDSTTTASRLVALLSVRRDTAAPINRPRPQ